jgi:hypothetical protein
MNTNPKEIMEKEIQQRLGSSQWVQMIARNVIDLKNQREAKIRNRRKYFFVSGIGAAVAAVFLVFLISSESVSKNRLLNDWILSQINGTYGSVFSQVKEANGQNGSAILGNDHFLGDVDYLIDDTLSMRLDATLTTINGE